MLEGFTRPFTPKGTASPLSPLPWKFSADQVMVHFTADPDVLDAYLPAPITPNPERRGEAFLWTPNLKCEPVKADTTGNILNPALTQYNVCVIAIPGLFKGKPVLISAFQWCDKDWLIILSWMIGTCAKQAEFRDNGVHPFYANVGSTQTGGIGTEFVRSVSRNGQELVRLSYTAEASITADDMTFFTSTFPLLSERHIPDFQIPPTGRPLVHDITKMLLEKSSAKNFVKGSGTLKFNEDADNEELGPLQPKTVIGCFRWQTSWIMTGVEVVHTY
jgi:hypothetical protein